MDTCPLASRCLGRFFRTDGKALGRAYNEHLRDINGRSQNIFKKKQTKGEARLYLLSRYKKVCVSRIEEHFSVRASIMSQYEDVLNCFPNLSATVSSASLHSTMNVFRSHSLCMSCLPFFLYRLMTLFC